MSWLSSTIDRLKDATRTEPLQCPRGWGEVSFVVEVGAMWPFFSFERKCPISGVTRCASCTYAYNPERIEALKVALDDLLELRHEGVLSEEEYQTRRASIIRFQETLAHESRVGREGAFRIAAWILGPLGVVFGLTGSWLAQSFHPGFWAISAAGGILLALSFSFAVLSMPPRDADLGFE